MQDAEIVADSDMVAFIEARGWQRSRYYSGYWDHPGLHSLKSAYQTERESEPQQPTPGSALYPFAEATEQWITCPVCSGRGEAVTVGSQADTCPECHGSGKTEAEPRAGIQAAIAAWLLALEKHNVTERELASAENNLKRIGEQFIFEERSK